MRNQLHIKLLLLFNILLTSSILLSKSLYVSAGIFLAGLIATRLFYDFKTIKKYFSLLYKFKVLFITLFLFQLLLRRQGDPVYQFSIFNFQFSITNDGIFYAVNSLLRYFIILLSATMLSQASPYQMIKALRSWKMPEMINILISFTILFLRQLQEDFKILNQNLKKRNITFKGKSLKYRFELISNLVIPVIGRLFSDIKYKVIAMELNGYHLHKNIRK